LGTIAVVKAEAWALLRRERKVKRVNVSEEENMEEEIVARARSLDQRPPRLTTSTVATRDLLVNDYGLVSTIRLPLNVAFVSDRLAMSRTPDG
jgi:hypothetical protein